MERKELIEEIISFCMEYRTINIPRNDTERIILVKHRIEEQLKNSSFVEDLIHTLLVKTRYIKGMDNKRLKDLLVELEKVRLDLEYDWIGVIALNSKEARGAL